jgi:hypothetical protein
MGLGHSLVYIDTQPPLVKHILDGEGVSNGGLLWLDGEARTRSLVRQTRLGFRRDFED